MLFNSYQFIFVFLPVVLAGCFVVARLIGPGAAQLWLIAASLYFYASWSLRYLPLLLGSILFNYVVAQLMVASASERRRGALLAGATVLNLALLGYYKYTNYFLDGVTALTGMEFAVQQIFLPLGISFYTFQQLTLLVDISEGSVRAFRFRDFILFVIFFPHLIAGPIVHHREMMPQFEAADYRPRLENLAVGLTLFVVGLFKKAVLADGIAEQVVPLFNMAADGTGLSLLQAWGAAVGFVLQMYFDFSGYSEMALGLARMVGITLPMNFNSPLKAMNVIQYWSCWHMTLTRFLTAYIYNPIAVAMTRRRLEGGLKGMRGARTTPGAFVMLTALPTLVTMFLSGLWHGAGTQFLVFGLLHGTYLVINHGWRLYRSRIWRDGPRYDRVMRPVGLVLTFVACSVALAFFRADSVAAGWNVVGGMMGLHGIDLPAAIATRLPVVASVLGSIGVRFVPSGLVAFLKLWSWACVLLAIALVPPNILQIMLPYAPSITPPAPVASDGRMMPLRPLSARLVWVPNAGWAVAMACLSVLGVLALSQVSEFLYWQF